MSYSQKVGIYLRALRFPFLTASTLPFLAGSLIHKESFQVIPFCLGLICVVATHLGANLINDFADTKTGVDSQDMDFYGYFGGSKLIQEGILSEKFYLVASILCFAVAFCCVIALSFILKVGLAIMMFFVIVFLSVFYSVGPLQFCYRRLGEIIIFVLFGPALVMGGQFIQTLVFPSPQGFLLSLPFGFFTTAILLANEIPDFFNDQKSGKKNWISLLGPKKAFRLYGLFIVLGFLSIALNIFRGYLGIVSWTTFLLVPVACRAINIQIKFFDQKRKLLESSKLTVALTTCVGIILVLDRMLK